MKEPSPYKDVRQEFFKEHFERGLFYDAYLQTGDPSHAQRWTDFAEQISLTPQQDDVIKGFNRKLNLLVLSGIWCGDCARQGPILKAIADANPCLSLRFLDNKLNPELQEELRINGAQKVPVVVALSEDFYELARFGDRHLSVYRQKGMSELGAACDPGLLPAQTSALVVEIAEWVDFFERIHWILRLAPALRKRYND